MKDDILVFGASLKPERYANKAVHRLRINDYSVKAFGLKSRVIRDVNIDTEPMDYSSIDTVTLYINPKRQKAYYNYILKLKPRRVIFNPGTENLEFYEILQNEGTAVDVACTLVLLATG